MLLIKIIIIWCILSIVMSFLFCSFFIAIKKIKITNKPNTIIKVIKTLWSKDEKENK